MRSTHLFPLVALWVLLGAAIAAVGYGAITQGLLAQSVWNDGVAFSLTAVLIVLAPLGIISYLRGNQAITLVLMTFLFFLVLFEGVGKVITVLYLLLSTVSLGNWVRRPSLSRAETCNAGMEYWLDFATGLCIYIAIFGSLLPFPVNTQITFFLLVTIPLVELATPTNVPADCA